MSKRPIISRDPVTSKVPSFNMRAKPNWEAMDADTEETPDRYRVPNGLIPEELSVQWVTDSVFGQAQPHHRAEFEKRGWTPVHQEDFGGVLDGKFMPSGRSGEINVDGMVLMVRPRELSEKAKAKDRRKALEQVAIKEASLTSGGLDKVTLDAAHPSAVRSNRISKSFERIEVPNDD